MSWRDFLYFIVPPEGQAHSRQWYAWAGFGVFSFWIFFWWSIGLMPDAFGEGFARAEDTKFNAQMLLEQRILLIKQNHCLATDTRSKQYWQSELTRMMILYNEKLGAEYREPPCDAIIVGTGAEQS